MSVSSQRRSSLMGRPPRGVPLRRGEDGRGRASDADVMTILLPPVPALLPQASAPAVVPHPAIAGHTIVTVQTPPSATPTNVPTIITPVIPMAPASNIAARAIDHPGPITAITNLAPAPTASVNHRVIAIGTLHRTVTAPGTIVTAAMVMTTGPAGPRRWCGVAVRCRPTSGGDDGIHLDEGVAAAMTTPRF